jgi:hypothetical protein
MVTPAGALTLKRKWAALIPRGATVYLAAPAGGREGLARLGG